jgi:hypothetical protein
MSMSFLPHFQVKAGYHGSEARGPNKPLEANNSNRVPNYLAEIKNRRDCNDKLGIQPCCRVRGAKGYAENYGDVFM